LIEIVVDAGTSSWCENKNLDLKQKNDTAQMLIKLKKNAQCLSVGRWKGCMLRHHCKARVSSLCT